MRTLDKTAWEILNATADDAENLEQIYLQVCFEVTSESAADGRKTLALRPAPGAPALDEIVESIRSLVQA